MSTTSATGENYRCLFLEKQKPEMFQEREVFTMHAQGTRKKLDGLRNLHRMSQTAGSKISGSES